MEIPFKNPLVVGYKGEIGSFILNGLLKVMPKALNVWCFDINESEEEKIERIKKSDYIFLCVPIQDTIQWLLKYKIYLKDKIVIEQCSLKTSIYENKKLDDIKIMSMHILFRPSATTVSENRKVALIRQGKLNRNWWVTDYKIAQIIQARIIWYDNYKQHDKDMAIQQALVHRILLTLEHHLKDSHATYVSQKVWELIERIKQGDRGLYSIIQANTELPKILEDFKENLNNFKI